MSNYNIEEIFRKMLEDESFKKIYFLAYLDRFVYSATDLEIELTPDQRKKVIENLLESFNFVMENEREKISPTDIVAIGNSVNKDSGIEGIRRISVSAGKYATWVPIEPCNIYYSLYSLLDNYYNTWNYRDVYEKEALFHIRLMRIHPFEDGNKRIAKIILNANLVKQNYPPVVISAHETEEYYNYINNEDYIGFAKFIKMKSLQELNAIIGYYKVAKGIPITDSVIDIINNDEGGRK